MGNSEVKIALKNDKQVVYTGVNGMPFESEIVQDELTKLMIERLNHWVSLDESPYERKDLELLGRILYNLMLPVGKTNNLRELFSHDYAHFCNSSEAEDRFHLTLELHEDARELGNYPWEFLFIPHEENLSKVELTKDRGFFLAGERNKLILTRFVPKIPSELIVKKEEPLRILVIFSHPKELPNINSRLTRDLIDEIKSLETLEQIEVRAEENPTHLQLYELMNGKDELDDAGRPPRDRVRFKPDIVHFIGHGKPGSLALIRNEGDIQADENDGKDRIEADWCDSEQVLALFANHTPRLVFLHACESASADSIKGFSDLARDLVYAKVPIVVAMQYIIKNKDAALFAKKFYEEIRNGSLIDEAVRAGREALGQAQDKKKSWADRRFGTPVIYFQTKSEQALIELPRKKPGKISSLKKYNPEEMVDCPNPRCPSHQLSIKLALGSAVCLECDHDLIHCPTCLKDDNEYRLMSKTIGRCGRCGYRMPERQGVTRSAGVAPITEQAAAQPATSNPSFDKSFGQSEWQMSANDQIKQTT
jgi:hypothetical protein